MIFIRQVSSPLVGNDLWSSLAGNTDTLGSPFAFSNRKWRPFSRHHLLRASVCNVLQKLHAVCCRLDCPLNCSFMDTGNLKRSVVAPVFAEWVFLALALPYLFCKVVHPIVAQLLCKPKLA